MICNDKKCLHYSQLLGNCGSGEPKDCLIKIKPFAIRICGQCYELEPGQCHNPDCVFCRKTKEEVSKILDTLLIRPIVDGQQLPMAPWREISE